MGKITIAIYRPKPGREKYLMKLIEEHKPILKTQDLVTDRRPVVMQAADRSVIEIFEWKSPEAIRDAQSNLEVSKLWDRFNEVCDYAAPVNIKEFQSIFSEFTPIN